MASPATGDIQAVAQADAGPSVACVGVFDGVHVGHRALVGRARELADRAGARVVVLSFDPPPKAVLSPREAPRAPLASFDRRAALLGRAGADRVLRLEPTPELLGLSPQAFVDGVLMPLRPVAVVEGPDFRFGRRRSGDVRTLASLGASRGFTVEVVEPVEVALHDQTIVRASSSMARWLLGNGRAGDAARVLGRWHELAGPVRAGDKLGRTIGFPTANLETSDLLPADGVYAAWARVPGVASPLAAAVNVGARPTVGGATRRAEAHLLATDGRAKDLPADPLADLGYDWPLTLSLVRWVRDQVRFGSVASLRAQLARDVARVAPLLAAADEPAPRLVNRAESRAVNDRAATGRVAKERAV